MGIHRNAVLTPTGREILVRRGVDEGQRPMSVAADKRCGIEGVHIHDIRATYSTHLIAGGESAKAVGKTMGHADAKTTMRYERIAQDRAKDIAAKVDDLF